MLKKIADILLEQMRSIDTVARFGGDEFVIVIPDVEGNGDPESVWERSPPRYLKPHRMNLRLIAKSFIRR